MSICVITLGAQSAKDSVMVILSGSDIQPLRTVRWARFGTTFSTTLAPFLSRLSLLGVTFGGLEMQLAGPKTDFGAQGAP